MVATQGLSTPVTVDKPTGTRQVPAFNGIRGLCAVGVLIYHVAFVSGTSNHFSDPHTSIWGYVIEALTVSLPPFFILSGFFLYRPFARVVLSGAPKPAIRPFLVKRALRVLPGYWVMTAIVLVTLNLYDIKNVWYAARPFLLLHFFWTNDTWITGLEPSWTVVAEVAFYLTLPLMAWAINRYARRAAAPAQRMRRMMVPLAVLVLIGFAYTAFCYLPAMNEYVWWISFWPLGYVGFFAGGMALATFSTYAEVSETKPSFYRFVERHPNACWAAAAFFAILNIPKPFGEPGMGTWGALSQQMVSTVVSFAFALLLVAPLTVPNVKSRLMDAVLTNRPVLFLGRMSFGVYLWHVAVMDYWMGNGSMFGKVPVASPVLRGSIGFWELVSVTLVGSILLATLTYYLVERPAQRLRGRLAR
jgi:peptidoglycan/LPS O-acetylase OafA/YrhL